MGASDESRTLAVSLFVGGGGGGLTVSGAGVSTTVEAVLLELDIEGGWVVDSGAGSVGGGRVAGVSAAGTA